MQLAGIPESYISQCVAKNQFSIRCAMRVQLPSRSPPRRSAGLGRAGLLPDIIGRDGSRSCQSDSGKRLSRRGPARLWPSRPTWLSLQSDQRTPTLWHLRLTTTTSAAYRSALSQCLLIAGRSQQQLLLLHRMRRENTPSYVCFRRSPGTYALPG